MTHAQEILLKAAELIEKTGWTQGVYARDAASVSVDVESESACMFCMEGAMRKSEWGNYAKINAAMDHLVLFLRHKFGTTYSPALTIPAVNDCMVTSKEQAVALLRAAAKWNGLQDAG